MAETVSNWKRLIPTHLGGPLDNVYSELSYRLFLDSIANRSHKAMWDYVKKNKCKNVLEVGFGIGINLKKMLEITGDSCQFYSFDLFPKRCTYNLKIQRNERDKALAELRKKRNVQFFAGDSKKTLPRHIHNLPKMDLIFIDGGKDYTTRKSDWENCKKLMNSNSVCFIRDDSPEANQEISSKYYSKRIVSRVIWEQKGNRVILLKRRRHKR